MFFKYLADRIKKAVTAPSGPFDEPSGSNASRPAAAVNAMPPASPVVSSGAILNTATPSDKWDASVISSMDSVPNGLYWSMEGNGIPAAFIDNFAVLTSGESFRCLLVAVEAFATHPQFELQRRLSEAGLHHVVVRCATREVIQAIHATNTSASGRADVQTNIESIAWSLVNAAIEKNASDIHIETRGHLTRVFYRIHGERVEQLVMSTQTATEVCNVLYSVHGDADNKSTSWDDCKELTLSGWIKSCRSFRNRNKPCRNEKK